MKNLIICLFFSISLFAQKSGIVSYGVLLPDYKSKEKPNELIIEAKEIAEKNTYILEFNLTQSHFFLKKKMEDNNQKNEMINGIAYIIAGISNYYDKVKNRSINENIQGILIEDKDPVKEWEITSETKMIDSYLCYKAKYIEHNNVNGKDKSKTIIAWFTPSLPYSFGPNSYNGLPGLILELLDEESNKKYFVKSIALKSENIIIKFPEGKVLTQEEFMKRSSYIPR